MTEMQTNFANIAKGMVILVGGMEALSVLKVNGNNVRLESVERNKYGLKSQHSTSIASLCKQFADGFYTAK